MKWIGATKFMKSAVLFLIFNRPETTVQVFERIRAARPPKLYISADGPRTNRPGELERCEQARKIALNVDWPCEVKTLFRESNLGCKMGVASGIDWFFQNESEGIILEDDVLPMPSFFTFCDEMLERYRDDSTIGMITGSNLVSKRMNLDSSYFVSHVPLIWGWATWARAWKQYDVRMSSWPQWSKSEKIANTFHRDSLVTSYWRDALDRVYQNGMDTWDYQWLFACWQAGMYSIIPSQNLTDNLGYGVEATHTSMHKPDCLVESVPQDLNWPLIHPQYLTPDWRIDRMMFERIHGVSWMGYVRRQLRPLRKLFNSMRSKSVSYR